MGYVQCGECDTVFPFETLTELEAALIAAEFEAKKHFISDDFDCSSPNNHCEILIVFSDDQHQRPGTEWAPADGYLVRFRRNDGADDPEWARWERLKVTT